MRKKKAKAEGRFVDFSLTTNGTLLNDEIIEFLSDRGIGVTVSIDGPPEMNDQVAGVRQCRGSYDIIAPRVKKLIARHKSRAIAARVTLTAEVTDVRKIFAT